MNRNLFPGRRRSIEQERREQERAQAEARKPPSPGAMAMTAHDAIPQERGALEEAKQFLAGLLTKGPVPATVVRSDAEAAGYAWATLRRAKKALSVEAVKEGMKDGWLWKLPSKALRLAEDASRQDRGDS